MLSKDGTTTEHIEQATRGTLLDSAIRLGLLSANVHLPSEHVVELHTTSASSVSPTYITRLSANAET
jgi:hypothetical protein